MKRVLVVILLMSLSASSALATTYVRVEPDGSKTYSDRPLPGGQPVDIQPAQTYSAPPPPPIAASSRLPREQALLQQMNDFRYQSCTLSPKTDETFNNPQSVNVAVTLIPALRVGDVVTLQVDGVSIGTESTLSFVIPQPVRGSHTAQVAIKDRFGKAMCNASSTFHVLRTSLNSPARH